jgi:hypothetical protein
MGGRQSAAGWVCARGPRNISAGTLLAVLLQAMVAAVVYFALFFGVAGERNDRAEYVDRLLTLSGRNRRLAPAA